MKILYVLHSDRDETLDRIVAEQVKLHELVFFDLGQESDYQRLVQLIEESDRVIAW